MKNKNSKQFKIIPFFISLLIVLLITGGIGIYTTFYYGGTDLKFLEGYIGYDKNKNTNTGDYIEKFVQLESSKYILNSKETGLNYRDPKTGLVYEVDQTIEGNVYKGDFMHVENYFDIALYAILTESENTKGEIELSVSYSFYFYNINYEKLQNQKPVFQIAFVEGVGTNTDEDDDKLIGDEALEKMMADSSYGGDTISMKHSYTYAKNIFYLYDNGAKTVGTDYKIENGTNSLCAYKANLFNSSTYSYTNENEETISVGSKDFSDMESATFAIYQLITNDDGSESATTIIEGTIDNIFNEKDADKFVLKGYDHTYYKVPSFILYTWSTILMFTGISFVVSVILAALFYFIWVDDKQPTKKRK